MHYRTTIVLIAFVASGCHSLDSSNAAITLPSISGSSSTGFHRSSVTSSTDTRYNMEGKDSITEAKISYRKASGILTMDFDFAVYDSSWKTLKRSGDASVDFYLISGAGKAQSNPTETFSWRDLNDYPFGYFDDEVRHYRYSETCSVRYDGLDGMAVDYESNTIAGFKFEIQFQFVPHFDHMDIPESNPIICTFPFAFSLVAGDCELISPTLCNPGFAD